MFWGEYMFVNICSGLLLPFENIYTVYKLYNTSHITFLFHVDTLSNHMFWSPIFTGQDIIKLYKIKLVDCLANLYTVYKLYKLGNIGWWFNYVQCINN